MVITDPVKLEILTNKARAIAEEMGITLQRTGRTIYVKETADFATALVSRGGEFFGYPQRIGVSGFVGLNCRAALDYVGALEDGDIVITNDPYTTNGLSTHLPDIHLIKPYYVDGELACYGWCFVHSADIGGRVPSSISPSNTDVYQEGLSIPPVKLYRRGELVCDIERIYKANCRTGRQNWGDIQAMISALDVGERRVRELAADYGLETIQRVQEEILNYSERASRQALRLIPDGVYTFWDYLDDDYYSNVPIRVRVQLTVRDGLVEIDFDGTDPESESAINIPTAGTRHPWLVMRVVAFAHSYAPEVVVNAGLLRNVSVNAPQGSIVNSTRPAPVGVRAATALRVYDAVNGALAKACAERITACPTSIMLPVVIVEPARPGEEARVNVVQFLVGATGGRKGADGMDGRDPGMSSMANNPIEVVESEASIRVLEYGIRPDSGGPGQWRGGCGQLFRFMVTRDNCHLLARGIERTRFQPWGVCGGRPGARLSLYKISVNGSRRSLGKIDYEPVNRGDVIEIFMSGGGGFGDSFARDVDRVLKDVLLGFVSEDAARTEYGVVIRDGVVDAEATRALQGAGRTGAAGLFGFDDSRLAWERSFDDAGQSRLAKLLYDLPRTVRNDARRKFFSTLVPRLFELSRDETLSLVQALDGVRVDDVHDLVDRFAEAKAALDDDREDTEGGKAGARVTA